MAKISYFTLGCKLNFSESASIIRQFTESGFELVDYGEEADITIINTCSVTSQAEKKSKLATKKANKISPNGKTIVVGCSAQLRPDFFSKINGVELVVGTEQKFNIINLLKNNSEIKIHSCEISNVKNFDNAFSLSERTRSFLKIQDGCDYACSYCTIPLARGESRNTPIAEIVKQAEIISKNGVKEIVLTGVNIGDFGRSTNETFFELIQELEKVNEIERYRISSIEPNLLKDEIIEFVAKSKKFMPHFHIPLQSGSDEVLKMMKRRYNTKLFAERILAIKKHIPDAFIGVDLIVGFPGETDELFEKTYNLLCSIPFSYLHIFPYSDRPNTISNDIKPKVPSEKINEREKLLEKLNKQKHFDFVKNYLGTSQKVLFEAKTKSGFISGYTENYIRVNVKSQEKIINEIITVNLLEQNNEDFIGIIV